MTAPVGLTDVYDNGPSDPRLKNEPWGFAAVIEGPGGTTELRLQQGRYTVKWYDPRGGGPLQDGTVRTLNGPGSRPIGDPPSEKSSDWVVLVTRAE